MIEKIEEIFLRLLEKSPGIALTVLCIMLVRAMLRKYPKKYSYILWAGLGLRLLWVKPIHLETVRPFVSRDFGRRLAQNSGSTAHGASGIGMLTGGNPVVSPALDGAREAAVNSVDIGRILMLAATAVWVLGMVLFLGYFLAAYFKMRHRVRFAVRLRENIYECEAVDSPFVMGIVSPRIYLPLSMSEEQQKFVICHETGHIRRKDYLVKPLAFLLLGIYWFHPLVWVGYVLMCRDMEMSCDELAVNELGSRSKQTYSAALLAFAAERSLMGNVLGFGEHNAAKRIKNVLNFRIPGKARKVAAGLVCGLLIPVLGCEMALGEAESNTKAVTEAEDKVQSDAGAESQSVQALSGESLNAEQQNAEAQFGAARPEIAQALYEAATPYIGSAPAVGNLLNVMRENGIMPEDEGSMELLTDEPPYGLVIHFTDEPKDEEELCRKMYDTGLLLWALVENLENVEWTYPVYGDEAVGYRYYLGENELKGAFGVIEDIENIKEYGKSAEKVEELMKAAGIGREETLELQMPKDGDFVTSDSFSVEKLQQPDETTEVLDTALDVPEVEIQQGEDDSSSEAVIGGADGPTSIVTGEPDEQSTAVIGGADGPTSVFLAGKIEKTDLDTAIDGYLLQQNANTLDEIGQFPVVSHVRLESEIAPEFENGVYTVYLWTMCKRYDYKFGEGAEIEEKSTVFQPAVMEFWLDQNDEYQIKSYWEPDPDADPETAETILRETFPSDLWEAVLDGEPYRETLETKCDEEAEFFIKALDSVPYTTYETK